MCARKGPPEDDSPAEHNPETIIEVAPLREYARELLQADLELPREHTGRDSEEDKRKQFHHQLRSGTAPAEPRACAQGSDG